MGQWNPLFLLLPIESVIKEEQERYYHTLELADRAANSTVFIEFMLEIIGDALTEATSATNQASDQASDQVSDQVQKLLAVMGNGFSTAQSLMEQLELSHRPTFRKNYLVPALEAGLIEMKYPDKPRSPKQQYRRQLIY
ncbi:MAG: Fic family protein [Cyanobacteria bacterium P01_F01_bin.150]